MTPSRFLISANAKLPCHAPSAFWTDWIRGSRTHTHHAGRWLSRSATASVSKPQLPPTPKRTKDLQPLNVGFLIPSSTPINKHNQMLLHAITKPATLAATALCGRYCPSTYTVGSSRASASSYFSTSGNTPRTQRSELTRLPSLLEGCDYEHWLVIMQPPKGYPLRDDIVNCYIKTLAMALGSEEEAKKSIYSVSTKYYYAFGCKVPEDLIYKIKSLPDVKWVLPDSYLCDVESSYGGEPFIEGKIFPYDDKYHKHWVNDMQA